MSHNDSMTCIQCGQAINENDWTNDNVNLQFADAQMYAHKECPRNNNYNNNNSNYNPSNNNNQFQQFQQF